MKFFKSYFLIQIVPSVNRVCYGHRLTRDLGAQQFRPSATVRSCGAEPCKQGKQAIFNLLVALLEGDLGREEWIASNAFIVHTASTMNAVGGVELRKCAVKLCFFGDIH